MPEIRKLRMHLLVLYPQLMVTREAPDVHGRRKAVSDNMGPMEAAYLAANLLYQKAYSADYQFSPAEKIQNQALDPDQAKSIEKERRDTLHAMLNGHSQAISMRDLLAASDHFFTDLGILPTSSAKSMPSQSVAKGGL